MAVFASTRTGGIENIATDPLIEQPGGRTVAMGWQKIAARAGDHAGNTTTKESSR